MTEETPATPPPPAQPAAAKERPAHRRSVFFDHEARIRELIAAGYSYRQVLCILKLKKMHRSVLARWCARQGIASSATSASNPAARAAAAKKSEPLAGPAAANAASEPATEAAPPRTPAERTYRLISDALGPEPGDEWAAFRKPSAED